MKNKIPQIKKHLQDCQLVMIGGYLAPEDPSAIEDLEDNPFWAAVWVPNEKFDNMVHEYTAASLRGENIDLSKFVVGETVVWEPQETPSEDALKKLAELEKVYNIEIIDLEEHNQDASTSILQDLGVTNG